MSERKAIDQLAQDLWHETMTRKLTYPAGPRSAWETFEQARKQPWIDKVLAQKTK
jgi:hypothetical protein